MRRATAAAALASSCWSPSCSAKFWAASSCFFKSSYLSTHASVKYSAVNRSPVLRCVWRTWPGYKKLDCVDSTTGTCVTGASRVFVLLLACPLINIPLVRMGCTSHPEALFASRVKLVTVLTPTSPGLLHAVPVLNMLLVSHKAEQCSF